MALFSSAASLGSRCSAQLLQKLASAVVDMVELVSGQLPEVFIGRGVVGKRSQLLALGFSLAIFSIVSTTD